MRKALIHVSVLLSIILMATLIGCNQDEINKLKTSKEALEKENSQLKQDIVVLKKEIDDLKYGASRLLNTAREAFTKKNWFNAEQALEKLLKKHPGTIEYKKAEVLLKRVRAERLKEIDEERKTEEKRKKEEAKKLARALKNMKKKIDKVEDIIWYTPKNTPKYHLYSGVCFYVYVGIINGRVVDRLVVRYDGDDWLFIDNIKVKYDEHLAEIEFSKFKNKTTNSGSAGVSEQIDIFANPLIMAYLEGIAKAKKVTVRLSGKYSKDFVLTNNQKRALRDSLLASKYLKKHPPK